MFDVTPEEENEMRDAEWDLEDVKLGPIEERYKQPSLIVNEYLHHKALEEAADVSRRVDAYISGEDVRLPPPLASRGCRASVLINESLLRCMGLRFALHEMFLLSISECSTLHEVFDGQGALALLA